MKCTICKTGEYKDGKVTVTLEREKSIIVVKGVPASVCENCGEYILDETVTTNLMTIAENAMKNKAEIEVLNYAA